MLAAGEHVPRDRELLLWPLPRDISFDVAQDTLRKHATRALSLENQNSIGRRQITLFSCHGRFPFDILAPVKGTPGTLQEGGASFASTHWSIIARSALTDVPEAETAIARLCEMYWPPIYSFVRRRGYAPPDAQDLTQSFFAYFLRTKAYTRTDQLQGKFRCFLLASVKNFLANDWDRSQAIRRGGEYQFVSFDRKTAEAVYDTASDSTAEHLFDSQWAKTLAGRALNSLKNELYAEGKLELFEQLKAFLAGDSAIPSYDEASARTGLPRATVKTHVHRLRQQYREIVRREIARTVSSPHEVDEELHHLYKVLAQAA
jgi:DNA-directed RNA polymerase specialized sigma24 family protein